MTGSIGLATESLRNTRKLMDNQQENLARIGDPDATRVDASSLVTTISGAFKASTVYSSPVDNLSFRTRIDNIASASRAETFTKAYSEYQNILGGTEATESKLSRTFAEFISASNLLNSERDISIRQSFVDKAERLSGALNSIVGGVKSIRETVDNDLQVSLRNANTEIKQLFFVNQQISRASASNGATFRLYNDRDRAINNLAEKFSLDVSFGAKGQALVSLAGSKIELVSMGHYSEFSSSGNFSQNVNNESSPEDLTISLTRKNSEHRVVGSQDVLGGDVDEPKLIGGQIEALADLRDKNLKEALDSARFLTQTIADQVNTIHNDSSPWPPVSIMTSEKMVYGDDTLDFSGKLSLFALDKGGDQLEGNAGKLHRATIDFDTLRTNHPSGVPTIHDVIAEINVQLDDNLTGERYALGDIGLLGGDPTLPNNIRASDREYLLNNVQIAATKDIKDGEFVFDLDLYGNSYFGSDVEVVSVLSNGVPIAAANLPEKFTLEKDTTTRTDQEIKVPVNAAAGQLISVQIRVTGENGVVDEGVLQFTVDGTDTAVLNKRFTPTAAIPNPPNVGLPGFQNKISSHSGVARAKLVDINGVEILPSDNNTQGNLVIESNNGAAYRFALEGSDFSKKLGLNNFFTINNDEIHVRSDIVNDPNKISAGRASKSETSGIAIHDGKGIKSTASFVFNDLIGGSDFQAGDSITIAGIDIAIGVDVAAAGNLQGTLDNVINFIANNPDLNTKVTASRNNNTLVIEAVSGGSWGNAMVVEAGLTPAPFGNITVDLNATGVGTNANGTLTGGTDNSSTTTVSSYEIGRTSSEFFTELFALNDKIMEFEGSGLIPSSINTLGAFTSSFVTVMNNQYNDAKAESDTRLAVLDTLDKKFKEDFGIDPEGTYLELFNILSLYNMQSNLFAQIYKTTREVQETISNA